MTNHNLQELPHIRTPKERAQEEITEHGQWLANVCAPKLYGKRRCVPEVVMRIRELAEMISAYNRDHNPASPPPAEITRKVTMEETVKRVVDNSWLESAAYRATGV